MRGADGQHSSIGKIDSLQELVIGRMSTRTLEDTDFLKDSEKKGVTIDLKGSDTKAIELKLIQLKSTATASE